MSLYNYPIHTYTWFSSLLWRGYLARWTFAQPVVFIPQLELVTIPQNRPEVPGVMLGQGQA